MNANEKLSNKMNTLTIISSTVTFLTRSFTEKFQERGFLCEMIKPKPGAFEGHSGDISVLVIFIDNNLLEDTAGMVYIKDYAIENDVPIFLLGVPNELAIVEDILPKEQIKGSFMRPVDINEVINSIFNFMSFHKKGIKRTILVVDDNGTFLRNVKAMFDEKYQVMLASGAAMAIKSITLHKPDLILLDFEMPIVDGKQVFEMIKAETDFANIPVMFLTGANDAQTVTSIMQLRPEAYLLKDMMPSEIVATVDGYFTKQRMGR